MHENNTDLEKLPISLVRYSSWGDIREKLAHGVDVRTSLSGGKIKRQNEKHPEFENGSLF